MKLVYMGTPALAVPCLEMAAREHEIVAVVTQPDKRGGRGSKLIVPPVKAWALEHGVPILQPERARDEAFVQELATYSPDGIAVVAFGQILPQSVLDLAPQGCVNLHFSLLPRWRGAAPVQYAIWHGDPVTGVTTQHMVKQLDAGDVIEQVEVEIEAEETSGQLLERLTVIGAQVLATTLQMMQKGTAPRRPQEETGITLCPQITREMAQLHWKQPASHLSNVVRAMNPWPTAWYGWKEEAVKVWTAKPEPELSGPPGQILEARGSTLVVGTGQGALRLVEVQPAGKPRMGGGDWARGARLEPGMELS